MVGLVMLLGAVLLVYRSLPHRQLPEAEKWHRTPPENEQRHAKSKWDGVVFQEQPGPQFTFDPLPEVPEGIRGPSPPIIEPIEEGREAP